LKDDQLNLTSKSYRRDSGSSEEVGMLKPYLKSSGPAAQARIDHESLKGSALLLPSQKNEVITTKHEVVMSFVKRFVSPHPVKNMQEVVSGGCRQIPQRAVFEN